MDLDDTGADGESESHPLGLAGDKGLEHALSNVRRQSGAGVGDRQGDVPVPVGLGAEVEPTGTRGLGHGLDGVAPEIEQDLLDLDLLGEHPGIPVGLIDGKLDAGPLGLRPEESKDGVEDQAQGRRAQIRWLLAHEVPDLPDHLPGPLRLGGDAIHHVAALLAAAAAGLEHADAGPGVGCDGGQWVVELVGDPGGDLAQGAEPCHVGQLRLVTPNPLLGLLALGDVPEDHHGPEGGALLVANRRGAVLDGKAGAVLAPEDVIVHEAGLVVAEGGIDRAFVGRMGAPVGVTVMQYLVLIGADQLIGPPARQAQQGAVDEGGSSRQVHPIDPFRHGVEDQLLLLLQSRLGLHEPRIQPADPGGHEGHDQQGHHSQQQAEPVARDGLPQREGRRLVIGGKVQASQQLVHRLVVEGDRPARVAPGPCGEVIRGHPQQGDGHLLGQVVAGMAELAEGPFGEQRGAVDEGEVWVLSWIDDPKVRQTDGAFRLHLLQDVGAHRPGVVVAALHRQHHRIVGPGEVQSGQVPRGLDAALGQRVPGHLVAPQGIAVHRQQGAAPQVFQLGEVRMIRAGEDHPAEDVAPCPSDPVAHGGDARDPVAHLQVHVDAGVDQDEVHRLGRDGRVHRREIQWDDTELVSREGGSQIVRGRGPGTLGGGFAPVAQDPDADLGVGWRAERRARRQEEGARERGRLTGTTTAGGCGHWSPHGVSLDPPGVGPRRGRPTLGKTPKTKVVSANGTDPVLPGILVKINHPAAQGR